MFRISKRSLFGVAANGPTTNMLQPEETNTTLKQGVLIASLFSTFVMEQLLWDGQFITYPLFKRVRELDEQTFVSIHQDYVKSLGLPTYLPSCVYLANHLLLLFIRPSYIPRRYPLLMNLLNLLAVANTFGQLVPIHIRIDRTQKASTGEVQQLINYNRIRFGLVAVNCLLMLYLLGRGLRQKQS